MTARQIEPLVTINPRAVPQLSVVEGCGMLMPSTPFAYPQVVSRLSGSFHVVKFSVSAGQRNLWSGFDSRQLHQHLCRSPLSGTAGGWIGPRCAGRSPRDEIVRLTSNSDVR
jgi:hypothetical protein